MLNAALFICTLQKRLQ